MTWYIQIGDDIRRDQKITFPFFRDIDEDYSPSDLIFVDVLYQCEDVLVSSIRPGAPALPVHVPSILIAYYAPRDAPLHPSKGRKLVENCRLTSDLRGVPSSNFIRKYDKAWKP